MSQTRLSIPEHLQPYLEAEYCDDFPIDRFYVTKLHDEIVHDVLNAQQVGERLRHYGVNYLNATLLYGIPGTGKTTFARYLAYCMDLDSVHIKFAKLYDGVLGQTPSKISDIFQYMSTTSAIFLLDEIDAISQKRGTESDVTGGEISRITITLMQELDMMKRKNVDTIIIGCTNRNDIMDPALRDRFSIKKEVKALNVREKQEYITMYLNALGLPYSPENIKDYSASNPSLPQRDIEADVNRCLIRWIEEGEGANPFILDHIRDYE